MHLLGAESELKKDNTFNSEIQEVAVRCRILVKVVASDFFRKEKKTVWTISQYLVHLQQNIYSLCGPNELSLKG